MPKSINFFRPRFLKKVIRETILQAKQSQLLMIASSLAYTTILSIIPVLAVSFAIFKAFGGMERLYRILEPTILANLAEGSGEEAISALHRFIDNTHTATVGIGGLVALIFTCMSMLLSVEKAINRIWMARPSRSLFQRVSSYWLFITLGPLALSVAVGIATSVDFPLAYLFPGGLGMFFIAVGGFFCIYKWVPDTKVLWPCALISGVLTAICWNIARVAYIYYIQNIVKYNAVYGSLAAVPILLLWIDILWIIVLGGAAVTTALQKNWEVS